MNHSCSAQVSVYTGKIREMPVGTDLLPHLIFAGSYWEVLLYLKQIPDRSDVVVYIAPPQFTDQEMTQ